MRRIALVAVVVVLCAVPLGTLSAVQEDGYTLIASGLDGPLGMAFDADGSLWVSTYGVIDPGTTIVRVALDGTVAPFADGLQNPSGLAVDSGGTLYVSDERNSVFHVSDTGAVSLYISGEQVALQNPVALAFDAADNLYVLNGAGYVSKFDTNRKLIRLRFASGFSAPQAIAIDAAGTLYVSDSTGVIYAIDAETGAITGQVSTGYAGTEGGLAVDGAGTLYMADRARNVVIRVTDQEVTTCVSGIWQPRGLVLDGEGRLYITSFMVGLVFRVDGCGVSIDSRAYEPYLNTCTVRANAGANLRAGPATSFPVTGTLERRELRSADQRTVASDGFVWWHLVNGGWVRGDLVAPRGSCGHLPPLQ